MSKVKVILIIVMILIPTMLRSEDTLPERSDIHINYRWNLEDMYSSVDDWEKDFNYVESNLHNLSSYSGKLHKSGKAILSCLRARDEFQRVVEKLEVYAYLNMDADTRIAEYQTLSDRASILRVKLEEHISYLIPEIQQIQEEKLEQFLDKTDGLDIYRHYIEDLLRKKPNTLSVKEENILAMARTMAGAPGKIYGSLTTTDLEFPYYTNEEGENVQMSHGRYYKALYSKDQNVRRTAFEIMFSTFEKIQNTNASAFDASIKKDIFYAKAKNFESTLEAAVDKENIPIEVYLSLVETIGNELKPLHRYLKLRESYLQLDSQHLYDTSFPIISDVNLEIPYEQAKEILISAMAPLGEEYVMVVKEALHSRWIDVYENKGKSPGAYSWGSYDSHPYILMNYNGTIDDLFTLAHEMGHAVHTWYTNHNQPFVNSNYSLFVAEVASTFNENLVLKYMLNTTEDRNTKAALVDRWISNLIGTVYVQVMFAEFELNVHRLAEDSIPLTAETLNREYMKVLRKYYGDALVIDDMYKLNWGCIPHFYEQFYVYKYATSFCASSALAGKVLNETPGAVDDYLNFLKAGNSLYSIDVLRNAGVDMTEPQPILDTIEMLTGLIDDLENMLSN